MKALVTLPWLRSDQLRSKGIRQGCQTHSGQTGTDSVLHGVHVASSPVLPTCAGPILGLALHMARKLAPTHTPHARRSTKGLLCRQHGVRGHRLPYQPSMLAPGPSQNGLQATHVHYNQHRTGLVWEPHAAYAPKPCVGPTLGTRCRASPRAGT